MSPTVKFNSMRMLSPRSQSGAALILLVFMMALALIGFTYQYLDAKSARLNQQQNTAAALAEAKAGLIGYAVAHTTVPGRLPCPEDTVSIGTPNEGQARSSCNTDTLRIGRLPWRTLGIGKLVDGHGEPLWYAVSNGYRTAPINSETLPQLTVNGVANAAVAIVFSAGPALSGQSRSIVTSGNPPIQSNYLDAGNSDTNTTFFTSVSSSSFNDQLAIISHADIFAPLEKRVLGEIKNNALSYKNYWFAYPFPADFDPSMGSSSFIGDPTISGGSLPISDPGVVTSPANSRIEMTQTSGSSTVGSCTGDESSFVCNSTITPQTTTVTLPPPFNISITFSNYNGTGVARFVFENVGRGFTDVPILSVDDFLPNNPTPPYLKIDSGFYSITNKQLQRKLDSSGRGIIEIYFNLEGFMLGAGGPAQISAAMTSSQYPDNHSNWAKVGSWLIDNQWYKLLYYRVANLFLPSGRNSMPVCDSSCLTIKRTYSNGGSIDTSNLAGILLSSGKSLPITDYQNIAQVRPSTLLEDYFDSTRNVSAGTPVILDQVLPLKNTFNDQIQVLP